MWRFVAAAEALALQSDGALVPRPRRFAVTQGAPHEQIATRHKEAEVISIPVVVSAISSSSSSSSSCGLVSAAPLFEAAHDGPVILRAAPSSTMAVAERALSLK